MADKTFYNKKHLCIAAAMLMLCGCSPKEDSAAASADSSRQTEQQKEAEGIEITVIDTLPAVDETVPREWTPTPSSEMINIIGCEEAQQHIRQEDGTFSDERFSVYHVIFHDHDVSFAMPNNGKRIWSDSGGVIVRYAGDREYEICKELYEKNVVANNCREFNESMAKTRQLIKDGFLQDVLVKYLSRFPELQLENKELTLELIRAERTDRMDDNISLWELYYALTVGLEDGRSLTLGVMDITKVLNRWNDAQYRIWGNVSVMWELLEQPKEDKGETSLEVLPEGTFTDEASIYDYMEQYAEKRQITWECSRENNLWYDYLVWKGEGGGYEYQVAVPVMDEGAGSWMIQAKIKKGADSPEDCWYAASVFMQTFHENPYFYCVKEGDTLYGIARTYMGEGDSYPWLLADINRLTDPNFIYEGQLIEIPVNLR